MPTWMHFVNWMAMSSLAIVSLALIGVIGYAAVLVSWRYSDSSSRHGRPKRT